jgi:hypothetical protein
MPFKLDGTETVVKDGEMTRGKTKAVWKGDKLEATVISERSTKDRHVLARRRMARGRSLFHSTADEALLQKAPGKL